MGRDRHRVPLWQQPPPQSSWQRSRLQLHRALHPLQQLPEDDRRLQAPFQRDGNCSAAGLAKIAAAMANGGSLKGVKVLGEKGWKALHAKPTPGNLGMNLSEDIYFTQGGLAEFRPGGSHGFRDGYYGWIGYGGSVFQWHPKLKIGFAYVPTLMEFHC